MNSENDILNAMTFDTDGLVPVVAQESTTKEVLMLAWMSREALLETLATGRMCYWSRSRQKLWRKGESSGQTQTLKSLTIDCDGDTLLAIVDQKGVACHTGRKTCFFQRVENGKIIIAMEPEIAPEELYKS